LPNSPKLRERLQVNGYKHFSKVSAAGPQTSHILQKLNKSSDFKIIHKFEFDPYLCDYSCLTGLKLTLKRLKYIKTRTLEIRRMDQDSQREMNNIKTIGWILSKLKTLRKIRIEFPSSTNLDGSQVLAIYSSLRRCYLLKSLEWVVVESPLSAGEYYGIYGLLMQNLKKLEHYKEYTSIKNGIASFDWQDLEKLGDFPKVPQIKHIEMMYSISKEWSHIGEKGDIGDEMVQQYIRSHTGLETFQLQFIKTPFQSQESLEILQCLASLVHFRHLEYEFLNCGIGDVDIAVFAYGLSKIPQLKYLRFKVIQFALFSEIVDS